MNINLRGKDFPAKNLKEGDNNGGNITKGSSSSRTWIGLKDPRIVRVSRSSGGKDRHSKVRTIRGLRDRRIRLSIPTAIQLYDLQERLGLDQPSKAVDWLLNAAKHEIDELPPLQILPGIFSQNPPESSLGRVVDANTEYVKDDLNVFKIISNGVDEEDQATSPKSTPWNSDSPLSSTKGKEIRETKEHGSQEGIEVLNNVTHPYNSYNPWDPSNPSSPLPSFFPSYVTNPSLECEPKQINQFQMLNPSSQNLLSNSLYSVGNLPMRPPFNFNRTPRLVHSQNDIGSQPNKGNTSSSNAFI